MPLPQLPDNILDLLADWTPAGPPEPDEEEFAEANWFEIWDSPATKERQ